MNTKLNLFPIALALIASPIPCLATPILSVEFDWTPQPGFSQYSAMFLYGGGTTVNGVFTPNSLITYSIGTPFGVATPNTGPGISFYTDTAFGPSFQTSGVIEPIDYQNNPVAPDFQDFQGNGFSLAFQNQQEVVGSGRAFVISGTWTEIVTPVPDAAYSVMLLGIALTALGGFHAFRRSPLCYPVMKQILSFAIALILLVSAAAKIGATPIIYYIEFDWTPNNGQSQYDAFLRYSGGTTTGGVFSPTGLITYSFGTPFGTITPATHYPGFGFLTDTPYGPSFQIQGTVEPVVYPGNPASPGDQEFTGNDLALYFQGLNEHIAYFQNGSTHGENLTGIWTETVVTSPEAANSVILLGIEKGSGMNKCIFSFFFR